MCKEVNVLVQLPEEEPPATENNYQASSFLKELQDFTAGVQAAVGAGATVSGEIAWVPGL